MPRDLEDALLELLVERGALEPADALRLLRVLQTSTRPDLAEALEGLVDPVALRAACSDLPDFFVKRYAGFSAAAIPAIAEPPPFPVAPLDSAAVSAALPSTPRESRYDPHFSPDHGARRDTPRPGSPPPVPAAPAEPPAPVGAVTQDEPPPPVGAVTQDGPPPPVGAVTQDEPFVGAKTQDELPPAKPLPRRSFGEYQVAKELGRGAAGVVYLVTDAQGRKRALKLFLEVRDPIAARRFVREVRALSQIDHPNVVKVHDSGEVQGLVFYVMDLLDGETLEQSLEREAPLSPERAVKVATDCLDGLAAIHAAGVIHRDLKPANILIDRASGRAILIDFSIAKLTEASYTLTQEGMVVGTPTFMAPEQIRGEEVGPFTDLYALGVTLYCMLEGRGPWKDLTSYDQLFMVKLRREPPAVTTKGTPPWLVRLVQRLMAIQAEERFATAEQVLDAFGRGRKAIGPFEIIETLGRGAHATVYKARAADGREVALKLLERRDDAVSVSRLTRESRALARIDHDNVIRLREAGIVDGRTFLALEWVAGTTLGRLAAAGPLPLDALLRVGAQLSRGVAACHEQGIVHRDLKPENVLVTNEGVVKLIDFGLALIEGAEDPPQSFAGTPTYAAPEQCRGERATRLSDLYAIGVILFKLAAGRPPFEAESSVALAYKQMTEPAPSLARANKKTRKLSPVVATLLEKEPAKRYPSASELARDLELLAEGKAPQHAGLSEDEASGGWWPFSS